ncbi:Calcium influx-promoting protein ehs1 [Erysiphe neolycopersici]|uniref:Calcium influx-promoting protein ehs1 n=1 Tax=Erysiphe neolycopersici TaxID=212602 RepID=A0A420HTY4_9PEZI|nr:Calcium influx-promoting protein ehs1 [Erysiphe neolycopersici]
MSLPYLEAHIQPRHQIAKKILIKLLLLCVILSALEPTYAHEVNEALGASPHTINNKIGRSNDALKSSNQRSLDYDVDSKKKDEHDSEPRLKRQLSMPTTLKNNVMVPINLERGQLFSFMFSNDSLWNNKSPIISSNPSKLEPFSNHKSNSISNSLTKESKDLLFQDKSMAQDALLMTTQDVKKTKKNSAEIIETGNKKTIYITVTTCLQPKPVSSSIVTPPPQLQIYISQSQSNRFPGPARSDNPNPDSKQEIVNLVGGYALLTIEATSDVYLGVYATNNSNFVGTYSAQVAASVDAPYHYHEDNSESNLFIADSDTDSVLFYTGPFIHDGTNTTLLREWVSSPLPFVIFVAETSDFKNVIGLENSYCGLEQNVKILTPNLLATGIESNVATSVTMLGQSNLPRQQFLIDELKPGTEYMATLAIASHSYEGNFVGGGGRVFRSLTFNTLAADNCDLIHSLSFCDQVAYSVPSNPKKFPNSTSLAAFYDNNTQAIFKNFEKVLAQIPCEINPSGQYSLARTCDDCSRAYKNWLCAVNIPRCTDVLSPMPWLQPRAIDQAFPNGSHLSTALIQGQKTTADRFSRNVKIDEFVSPGPYKEVLPCQELCHSLVSSCPASLGFNCPRPGQVGFDTSYGQMPLGDTDSQGRKVNITCNFPGIFYFSTAYHWRPQLLITQVVFAITISMISMFMV